MESFCYKAIFIYSITIVLCIYILNCSGFFLHSLFIDLWVSCSADSFPRAEAEVISKKQTSVSCVMSCSQLLLAACCKKGWAQINTGCRRHPIYLRSRKGSGFGEGNMWKRNKCILPAFALGTLGTPHAPAFQVPSLDCRVLRNESITTWSRKDNWSMHSPARLMDLMVKVSKRWETRGPLLLIWIGNDKSAWL